MARKKTPCEWCEADNIIHIAEGNKNVEASLEIYPQNCFMGIIAIGINDEGEMTSENNVDIPMNFCPNCGRKLGY